MSINEQGLISLSGLWELSGKNPDKNPAAWWYSPPAVEMMAQLKREGVSPLWKFTKVSGRWRTLVCIQIATAYAQYLGLLDEAKPKLAQGQLALAVHGGKAFILKVEESGISPSGGGIAAKPEPTTPTLPSKFVIGDKPVATNGDGLVSLTDLWKVAGSKPGRHPKVWRKLDQAKHFIEEVSKRVGILTPLKTQLGKGIAQGTYAHWQIALAYAKYLSPELHMAVNEVFMRYKTGDPTLAEEVIDKVEDPDALERIEKRARAKKQYKRLASVVFAKGGSRTTIARVADTNNVSVTGHTAQSLKYVRGGKDYKSSREVYKPDELAQVAFLESLQARSMAKSMGGGKNVFVRLLL